MLLQKLIDKKLISPPEWLSTNTSYMTIMGSRAYGCADTTEPAQISDTDIYGFCIPRRDMIFRHLAGEIEGFGRQKSRFEQYQASHIQTENTEYDLTIFSIVKYFTLLMENNPNILDSLFTPQACVLHCTSVGNMVRENRKLFLHKGAFARFKGYSYSQLHKMSTKETAGKRKETRDKYGFDTKYAVHLVRLLYECEQILTEGDIDLQRHKEHLKAIRRGEVKEVDIREWAASKEKALEKMYEESKLPWGPPEEEIKDLLLKALEHHYGSLDKCIEVPDRYKSTLMKIKELLADIN
jgi:predicted nucleotidyltransferase